MTSTLLPDPTNQRLYGELKSLQVVSLKVENAFVENVYMRQLLVIRDIDSDEVAYDKTARRGLRVDVER